MNELLRKYSQVFLSRGLGEDAPKVYAKRRLSLVRSLGGMGVLTGVPSIPGSESTWFYSYDPHYQDPAFLYLTGINQVGCLWAWDGKEEYLFLPPRRPEREFWDGTMLALSEDLSNRSELMQLTGFRQILPSADFPKWLASHLRNLGKGTLWSYWFDAIKDHHIAQRTYLSAQQRKYASRSKLESMAAKLLAQRSILDVPRQQMARRAQVKTQRAFVETLAHLSDFADEHGVAKYLESKLLTQGYDGLAFPTIAGCGDGAATLHYVKNDEPLEKGRLLLLDFGVREGALCSDISRTVPVSGRFNPLQRLLYQIVLDTQKFHESQVKPGLTLKQLNMQAWDYLENLLVERFLSKGGLVRRNYSFRVGTKAPHGISHLIGDQVHEGDPMRQYQESPLKLGMMISNEPGLYGTFTGVFDGVRYSETLGIRIEDDLLITAHGAENLSEAIPKEIADLESIIH